MRVSIDISSFPSMNLGPEKLTAFFIDHLNIIYCAKTHLEERLPEIEEQSHFADLKQVISKTIVDVIHQIARMEEIFALLNVKPSMSNCNGLVAMIEDAYMAIHEQSNNPKLRDLTILFYMQNIESIEMASFQILQIVAANLGNKPVAQLLQENFEEAKHDRALLLLLTTKYIAN